MTTIHILLHSSLAPERVLEAAHDFSARRAEIWPAVSVPRLTVHDQGDGWADVTEGTRAGPVVNWERCRYEWSQPGSVTATVTDSNVYAVPASSWQIKSEPSEDGGTRVEMIWERVFRPGPRGWLFATAFRLVGRRLFGGYARDVLQNLERIERDTPSDSSGTPRRALMGGGAALGVLAAVVVLLAGCAAAMAAPLGQIAEFSAGAQAGDPNDLDDIAAGADGNTWLTIGGDTPAIERITPTGQITEFTAGLQPSVSSPGQITAGADGNMWFTDDSLTPAIGRITPTGQITEFTAGLGTSNYSIPSGIAAGADGNVWFTDEGGSTGTRAIGRITPTGQITEFSAGLQANNGSLPIAITAGADGNMWFTDESTGTGSTRAIGRITPTGQITEFSAGLLPSDGSRPLNIAAGADGNVWFTDPGAIPAIGRITPTGQITEFTTGLQANNGSHPIDITAGADGNMWFTDKGYPGNGGTPSIGRITPTGEITEFTTGLQANNDSNPLEIAAGADGNIWFIDDGPIHAFGRIGTGALEASIAPPSVIGSGQQGTQQVCEGDRWSDWAWQQPLLSTIPGFPAYQWSRDGTAITGATSQSYTPVTGDVGHALTCTVTVTYALLGTTETATSATATVIPQSSGPAGPAGMTGAPGMSGATGAAGTPGAPGMSGATGPSGAPGASGAPGMSGAMGATGATGSQGPAGQVELVTCKTVTRKHERVRATKQACSSKLVSGPVKFATANVDQRASLSRAGVTYATGYAHRTSSGLRTSLIAARTLARGRYLLTLTSSHGARTTASHEQVTIR